MAKLIRDGVGLAYQEAGSGAPPIMLVHDRGSDHTCFASQFEYFRRRHRVVAVDLRGHGESDKPRGAYTVDVLADDLAWLCYELGLYRPVILGRGLAGAVVLDLAARYQDLPAAVIALPAEASPTTPVTASLPGANTPQQGEATLPEGIISLFVEEFVSGLAGRAPP